MTSSVALVPAQSGNNRGKVTKELRGVFKHYVHLPFEELADVMAVWTFGTHCFELFDSYPQIVLHGTKESGKSRCMRLMSWTAARPEYLVSVTPATVFRLIEELKPTLLIDEATELSRGTGVLVEIFKAGYVQGASVPRIDPATKRVKRFNVFCPKVAAFTGSFDHIVADRALAISMQRSRAPVPDVGTAGFEGHCRELQDDCALLAIGGYSELSATLERERRLCGLTGRQRELWLPMLALARFLGGLELWVRINHARRILLLGKVSEERDSNPDVAFLVALSAHLRENGAILDRTGVSTDWRSSDKLIECLRTDAAAGIRTKNSLTRALKRLGIVDSRGYDQAYKRLTPDQTRLTAAGRQVHCYRIEPDRVLEAWDLYVGGETPEPPQGPVAAA